MVVVSNDFFLNYCSTFYIQLTQFVHYHRAASIFARDHALISLAAHIFVVFLHFCSKSVRRSYTCFSCHVTAEQGIIDEMYITLLLPKTVKA